MAPGDPPPAHPEAGALPCRGQTSAARDPGEIWLPPALFMNLDLPPPCAAKPKMHWQGGAAVLDRPAAGELLSQDAAGRDPPHGRQLCGEAERPPASPRKPSPRVSFIPRFPGEESRLRKTLAAATTWLCSGCAGLGRTKTVP